MVQARRSSGGAKKPRLCSEKLARHVWKRPIVFRPVVEAGIHGDRGLRFMSPDELRNWAEPSGVSVSSQLYLNQQLNQFRYSHGNLFRTSVMEEDAAEIDMRYTALPKWLRCTISNALP